MSFAAHRVMGEFGLPGFPKAHKAANRVSPNGDYTIGIQPRIADVLESELARTDGISRAQSAPGDS
jgi:hypothetical protein